MLCRTSPRVVPLCSALTLFSLGFAAIGCAHLPYLLTQNRDNIVGIEIALQPDATFRDRANTGNTPITLVRGFVRSSDIDELSAVVGHVLETTKLEELSLTATGYQSGVWNGMTGAAMTLQASPPLRRLEERMVEGLRPFALDPEFESATEFIVTPDGALMSEETVAAVERFIPDASGLNFRPHVFVPAVQQEAATRQASQPFTAFAFKPADVAVYQLSGLGQPARLLWTWTASRGTKWP